MGRLKIIPAVAAGMSVIAGLFIAGGIAYATVPTFSQSSVIVGTQQPLSVTTANGTSVYLGSNSSPITVNVSTNGSQITLTGLAPGFATLQFCNVGTASDCANLAVTVQAGSVSSSGSGLSFSQNNLSLSSGSNQSVTLSGGNGSYSISSNSNTSVVSVSLSGSTLTVSGLSSGSASVGICDTSSNCGTLSVSVNSSTVSSTTSGLSFSQNNISVVQGQNQTVTVSGDDGVYVISNSSNSSVASAGISNGNSVVVFGSAPGSDTITVCDTSNLCGQLSLTVTAAAQNQAVTFSVPNPTLNVGQSLNDQLSGEGTSYFVSSNQNPNMVQATINNATTLTLYGGTAGTDSLTICAAGGAGCDQLSVTVTGASSATTAPTTTAIAPTPTTTSVTPATVAPSSVSVVANAALLSEIQTLSNAVTQALSQIQSIQNQLTQLEAQVSAGSGSTINTNAAGVSSGEFTESLSVGSEDSQVTALQQRLTNLGLYSGPITGYYGSLTEQAVIKYQTANGLEATGSVGPGTRASLNAGG